jgi:hypothetical protein
LRWISLLADASTAPAAALDLAESISDLQCVVLTTNEQTISAKIEDMPEGMATLFSAISLTLSVGRSDFASQAANLE